MVVREENWKDFYFRCDLLCKDFSSCTYFDYGLQLDSLVRSYIWVLYIFTQQPVFKKLGTSNKITPLQLESLLTNGNTSKLWLVEFRASYSPSCIRSSWCFPELSITV